MARRGLLDLLARAYIASENLANMETRMFWKNKKSTLAKKSNASLQSVLAEYLVLPPTDQNAFDMFEKTWSTIIPDVETHGTFPGTVDDRIVWLLDHVKIAGKSVLELGPLEAGHTYMLEKAGANVLAIESNKGAFLRSLIVKNHLNLSSKFLLGDFEKFDFAAQKFDVCLASGVLYHMKNPCELLFNISKSADKLFIWTHYFDPDLSKWNPALADRLKNGKWDYKNPVKITSNGYEATIVRQQYGDALGWDGFCGGTDLYSNWLMREDLFGFLKHIGYKTLTPSFDSVDHPNGPAICILCER